jgi:6-pyruvoyltetrahydropterin/6-carboxytetrahydropterin synthase
MKYKLSVTKDFASAHCLRKYKGKCENLHGHSWKVRVSFIGSKLDDAGMLIDFTDIKQSLDKIIVRLDHKCLNEIDPFNEINPTAENIAAFVYEQLRPMESKDAQVCEVEVWESESSSVIVSV